MQLTQLGEHELIVLVLFVHTLAPKWYLVHIFLAQLAKTILVVPLQYVRHIFLLQAAPHRSSTAHFEATILLQPIDVPVQAVDRIVTVVV